MGVQLRNIRKVFGPVGVIHDVSMDIPTGEFAVFVGPSGCGKSTLLRMIAGLEDTSGGKISIEGTDVTWQEPAKRGVAWSSSPMRFIRIFPSSRTWPFPCV